MQPTKAIIFDLDGVLVNTARFHFKAWKKIANTLNIEFDHPQNEQLKGVSRVDSLQKILNWGNIELSESEFEQLMHKKNADYLTYISQLTKADILPGVSQTLSFFAAHNIPLAVGSASKNARFILEKLGLTPAFNSIVDGTDVTKAKPDPEVFLIGAKKLGVAPKNCIVFEDAVAGIQAAKAAEMTSIGIGNAEVLHEADYNFTDFTEITTEFLQKLITK